MIPELLARGMGVKVGDPVVIVATNQDGSVNGKQFTVSGVLESATGPGGRDGYIHIEDAMEVLRMGAMEISEVAIRLKDFGEVDSFTRKLEGLLAKQVNQKGTPYLRGPSLGEALPLLQYRPNDRRDDLLHQNHADRRRLDQHHERHDHGGV